MGTCGDGGVAAAIGGFGDGDRMGSRWREWGGSTLFFLLEVGGGSENVARYYAVAGVEIMEKVLTM